MTKEQEAKVTEELTKVFGADSKEAGYEEYRGCLRKSGYTEEEAKHKVDSLGLRSYKCDHCNY